MQFESERALRNYEQHPIHKRAVSDVLQPLTAKVLVYDIRHDEHSPLMRR
jgi:hypothetical protein